MASSTRTLRPLLRSAPPRLTTTLTPPTKRFLNWATATPLTTAQATVTGGRKGHASTPHFQLDLGMPTDLGGDGQNTNPEELFAAGYGACFQAAMGATAPTLGIKYTDSTVETAVHLIGDLQKLDMGLRVDMKIRGKGGITVEELERLVERTKKVCPYSRATEGNVVTNTVVSVE